MPLDPWDPFNAAFEAMAPGVFQSLGGQLIVIKRPVLLRAGALAKLESMVVQVAVAAASSITLRAADGSRVSGAMPLGASLTIGTDVYKTTTDINQPIAAVDLVVPIAPALGVSPPAVSTPVALGPVVWTLTRKSLVWDYQRKQDEGPDSVGFIVSVPTLGAEFEPAIGDVVVLANGVQARVQAEPKRESRGYWDLRCGYV